MQSEAVRSDEGACGEKQRVVSWRAEELQRAGYTAFAADVLAVHTEVDLHRAVSLPRNGCPHDLALKILL